MEAMFPATFPSGQGSDFAGRVVETGPGVTGFAPGDEVMGRSDRRSAQADHVLSDPRHLIAKPPALDMRCGRTRRAGARVLSIASADHADLLRAIGVEPVAYGDGLGDRLRSLAPSGIDAFVDAHGGGYVDLAVALRVAPHRIDTIIDFDCAQRHAPKTDTSPQVSDPDILATMAEHVAGHGSRRLADCAGVAWL